MQQIRGRLTYANVISTLCLFLLLGGGAAYAAMHLPKNSVGTKQLKKNAVNAAKLKKNSVNSAKVKNHSLRAVDFKAGQLPAGPKGATGATGAQGATGPRGPSDVYTAFNNTTVSNTKTLQLALPAGSYRLMGSMYAITSDSVNYGEVDCEIDSTNRTAGLDGSAARTVGPAASGSTNYNVLIANTAMTIGSGGGTVELYCSRFAGSATISFYQARIIATQVGALH